MLLSNKGDSWLKWTLILGSSSTTVWKEKIKAQKQLANSDITVFFFLKIYIYIYIQTHTHTYIYIPIPKKGNAKECSNYCTIALVSHVSKVMLKILQTRLQQYENCVQAGFRKGRGTRDQIANIRWIIKKAREFQKNIYFCFIDHAKAFDCVDHNKLWKTLKEMGKTDNLTCLLRNLYAGQ